MPLRSEEKGVGLAHHHSRNFGQQVGIGGIFIARTPNNQFPVWQRAGEAYPRQPFANRVKAVRKFIAVLGVLAILAVACWNGGEEAAPTTGGARTAPAARGEESADETTTEVAAPEPEYPEITISIGHSGAPDGHADIAAVKFKELVESGSDGLMTVEVFPSSQMGRERDLVEGAQLGLIDAGVVLAEILESFVPEMGVVSLPFLFDGQDHVDAVFDGPVGRELLGLAEGVGIKALAIGQYGLRSMMNSQRPIYIPFDAVGLRFGVPESDIYVRIYELVGANPVPLPDAEVVASLQNGVVDGTGAPIVAAVTRKYYETPVQYLSLTEHIYAALLLFMSGELWDSLPANAQDLIEQSAIAAASHQRAEAAKLEAGYLAELQNQGWEVNEVDKVLFREAVAPIYDERPELAEWVDRIRAVSPQGAVDVSLLPEITINIGHSGASDSYADIAAVRFKELVGERSSGRMSVEVYPSSQIGSERDLVEGAQVGWIDAGVVSAGILEGLLPEVGVVSLPFLFDGQDHVDAVFDGPVGRELLGMAGGVGIKALAIGQYGLRSMMNSRRSIYVPADAADLRFGVPESDIDMRTYELVGANPVPLPGPEIFTSLQNEVVDGTGAPLFVAVTRKYYETPVQYLSLTEHIYAALVLFMSGELWDSLGPAAQQLVQEAAIEAAAHQRAEAAKLDVGYLAELQIQGWEVNEVDKDAFREAVAPIYNERPELAEWVDRIREAAP